MQTSLIAIHIQEQFSKQGLIKTSVLQATLSHYACKEKEMAQKAVLMDAVFINAVDGLVTSKVKTREDAQTYWEHTARPSPRDYGIGDR